LFFPHNILGNDAEKGARLQRWSETKTLTESQNAAVTK